MRVSSFVPSALLVPCLLVVALVAIACSPNAAQAAEPVKFGFAKVDVTPDVNARPVWIAGYGQNRKAKGVHDPLYARAAVFNDGKKKIAMVAVDVVGLQYPQVQEMRKGLDGFDYVVVSSTHNHEGPDTVGIWGPNPYTSGVDPIWIGRVVEGVREAVRKADSAAKPVTAVYGTATDDSLLRDSRLPHTPDGVIRVAKLDGADGKAAGLIVQWTCHPEALGSDNTQLTADFPWATIKNLEAKYNCPVVYFSGAVGGLMTTPSNKYKESRGVNDASFEYAQIYGDEVADLTVKALEKTEPCPLAPIAFAAKPICVPLENPLFRIAQMAGVLKREGREYTGDFENTETPLSGKSKGPAGGISEVAYIQLGDLHIACIPGEVYPELVYGTFQEPAEPGVDYPDAPLEPTITGTLPGKKFMLIGLANDELGYIIPKRQWDEKKPFAYGKKDAQYGEQNSCGPQMAGILMQALVNRVADVRKANGK